MRKIWIYFLVSGYHLQAYGGSKKALHGYVLEK